MDWARTGHALGTGGLGTAWASWAQERGTTRAEWARTDWARAGTAQANWAQTGHGRVEHGRIVSMSRVPTSV
jgi:hypothetical protein